MNSSTIALLALRSVGTLATLQGQPAVGTTINKLVSAYEAGRRVDKQMQMVADKLEAGDLDGWEEISDRLDAVVADFLDEEPELPDPPAT